MVNLKRLQPKRRRISPQPRVHYGFKRARVGSRPVFIPGVDAIDITGLSAGPLVLNHTVFVDNPLVFGDMHRLMATSDRPPDKRTPLFAPVKTANGIYWMYKRATTT